jgi:hypothetical protein
MGTFRKICKRTFVMAILASVAGIASAADEAGRHQSMVEWNFTNGDDGGWRYGWSKTGDTSISPDFDVINGLGLQLTFDFHESQWGDSNIKTLWTVGQAPGAVNLRILAPVAGGKPKGPMQLGCAMNSPAWVESGQWIDLKFPEAVTISGVEYRAQTVTCELGTSLNAPLSRDLVIRFGGDAVRYKGVLYIQQIRALRIPGAPTISTPAVSTPVRTAPVVNTPVRTAPVVNAPVVVAPVRTAPVVVAPVVAAPSRKSHSRTLHHFSAPVSSEPIVVAPVVAAPVSSAPEGNAPGNKFKPVLVEPTRVEPVRAQRNVD